MAVLGIDLGGTKLAVAVFSPRGKIHFKESIPLDGRKGKEVGLLITGTIQNLIATYKGSPDSIQSIGIAVPGISRHKTGTVWAPNISGWDDYPLLNEVRQVSYFTPVTIDSDRACYILGELWQGNAQGCSDAIYLAVGTGIGAGILVNGKILRGAYDVGGAIGWMSLNRPFEEKYISCGCFEYHASGAGIAKIATELLAGTSGYEGELKKKSSDVTAQDVFTAYEKKDVIAMAVIHECIEFWGMAVANLVSLFNPEKIIFGGGVFGPAVRLIEAIESEARKWAQPISMTQVRLEASKLGNDAGLYGAGYLALQRINAQL